MMLLFLILLVSLAMIFTMLSFFVVELPSKTICIMLSIIMWMSAALGSVVVQVPYQIENSTSGEVIEGVQSLSGTEPGLSWLFLGIGVLMIAYGWYAVSREGSHK